MISVIIPTYNRGYILQTTLHAYFSNLVSEIIIVDDGSNDNTEEVVKNLAKVNENIKYIKHKRRLGLPSARNTGINFVSKNSEYIFFGEDDVILSENCYSVMLEALKSYSLDLIGTNVKYLSENEDYKKYFLEKIEILFPRSVYDIFRFKAIHLGKRKIYEELKFDEKYILSSYREETDFYLRAAKKYKIAMINNYLAFNLPRSMCSKGGEWSYNPIVYEFSAIYNNFRFFIKNKDLIKLSFKDCLKEQTKFVVERLRSLKAKILK